MVEIGSFEAKTHFSDLLRRIITDREEFRVTLRGKPVAMLTPIEVAKPSAAEITGILNKLRDFRSATAKHGPVLEQSEDWKSFAREGLE